MNIVVQPINKEEFETDIMIFTNEWLPQYLEYYHTQKAQFTIGVETSEDSISILPVFRVNYNSGKYRVGLGKWGYSDYLDFAMVPFSADKFQRFLIALEKQGTLKWWRGFRPVIHIEVIGE